MVTDGPDYSSWNIHQFGEVICSQEKGDSTRGIEVTQNCCLDLEEEYTITCEDERMQNGWDYVSEGIDGYLRVGSTKYCDEFVRKEVNVINRNTFF